MQNLRRNVKVKFREFEYDCVPSPALLLEIESEEGFPIREIVRSNRITHHTWVVYCALKERIPLLKHEDVIEESIKEPGSVEGASLKLCIEILAPASAREAEEHEAEEHEGEQNAPPQAE